MIITFIQNPAIPAAPAPIDKGSILPFAEQYAQICADAWQEEASPSFWSSDVKYINGGVPSCAIEAAEYLECPDQSMENGILAVTCFGQKCAF